MITVLIVVLVVLAAAGGAGLAVLKQRTQRGGDEAPFSVGTVPGVPAPPPMTGLEAALDQIADRSGRTLRDKLEAESAVVDDLRVPDDTGPLLRRALDRVAQPGDSVAEGADEAGATDDESNPPGATPS